MSIWYRYDIFYGDVVLYTFTPERETEKCVFIGGKRILKEARKRWACPSIEEARVSFVARKKRQLQIVRGIEHSARKALEIAERNELPDNERDRVSIEPEVVEFNWPESIS